MSFEEKDVLFEEEDALFKEKECCSSEKDEDVLFTWKLSSGFWAGQWIVSTAAGQTPSGCGFLCYPASVRIAGAWDIMGAKLLSLDDS